MTNIELIKEAIEAKKMAYAPCSEFNVGAALLTENGKVYRGCNIESGDYVMNICAERVALAKAISEGEKNFSKIAIVGGKGNSLKYTPPCGICRHFLSKFNINMEIVLGYMEDGEIKEKTFVLKDLLPESFSI